MRDIAEDDIANKPSNRGNTQLLLSSLAPDEKVVEIAEARRRGLTLGLLVVTNQRILYVQERIFRKAIRVAHDFREIREVRTLLRPVTGELTVDTVNGSVTYRTISPKERTNLLAEAIATAAHHAVR